MRRRSNLQLGFALAVLGLFLLAGLFGGVIAPHDPQQQNLANTLKPPAWHADGSSAHWLGTTSLGQDVLSNLMAGARVSLLVALCAVGLSGVFGVAVGLVAGYVGGWVDAVLMRLSDIQVSIPFILLAIALIGALGPSLTNVILVIAVTNWVAYAKLVRTETARLRDRDFVRFARVSGTPWPLLFWRHLLPNVTNSVVVLVTLDIGKVIIFESGLSFLGLGVQPPMASLGTLIANGAQDMELAWWLLVFPSLTMVVTLMCFNFIGDGLRDAIDPKDR